jgi:geranylgeranyl pyrophosphate synthase
VFQGGGTPQEVETLADYFRESAFAFQIIDDVLNLRGFETGAKTRGEDITEGALPPLPPAII